MNLIPYSSFDGLLYYFRSENAVAGVARRSYFVHFKSGCEHKIAPIDYLSTNYACFFGPDNATDVEIFF
jgi:hypothetical protein